MEIKDFTKIPIAKLSLLWASISIKFPSSKSRSQANVTELFSTRLRTFIIGNEVISGQDPKKDGHRNYPPPPPQFSSTERHYGVVEYAKMTSNFVVT